MLLKAKVSEQEEEQEKLHLCLTGFYLRKPVIQVILFTGNFNKKEFVLSYLKQHSQD